MKRLFELIPARRNHMRPDCWNNSSLQGPAIALKKKPARIGIAMLMVKVKTRMTEATPYYLKVFEIASSNSNVILIVDWRKEKKIQNKYSTSETD